MLPASLRKPIAPAYPTSRWIGPRAEDLEKDGVTLKRAVPGDRWPYGPPSHHQQGCRLFAAGRFCDCKASDASDWEYGDGTYAPLHRP